MNKALRGMLTWAVLVSMAPMAALVASGQAAANALVNSGFEASLDGEVLTGPWPPTTVGTWGTDRGIVRSTTGALGVTPHSGVRMVELDATGGVSTDFYQLIDVSGFGGETAVVSAWFNSAVGSQHFGITLRTWTGALPLSAASAINLQYIPGPGSALTGFTTDADAATWEQLTGLYYIDPNATYIALGIHAPTSGARAFADDISFDHSIPEPGSLSILGAALIGFGLIRRRKTA